ncbi:hypothetical protein F6U93_14430 [Tamlana haliotis]|uniref:Uncharacterized protein n=1 Tax=Pseudotamlana haliotis TaxID=2614804 RepID=A0A6N6M8H1_9FLAO|nr:hypothetical protein [Tamlana haliotis]KAB1064948.1 hypothetical protein F6U93_14430 [Tamlana haliotis]
MKDISKIFYFGLLISLSNCGIGEWDVELYQQRIPNSSKVIYEYDAWGGRDSHTSGIVLMDSIEKFKVNSSRKLPISYFSALPNKNRIKSIELKKAVNNDEITLDKIDSKKLNNSGIDIVVDYYEKYSGYSNAACLLNKYEFESFKETNDSLFIYGLDEKFGKNLKDKNSVSFQKGNIKLITDENGKIFRVVIKELFKDNATKFKYKKGTAEITEKITDSPVICFRVYYFLPKKEIYESEFSDYGIYKRVK